MRYLVKVRTSYDHDLIIEAADETEAALEAGRGSEQYHHEVLAVAPYPFNEEA